MADAKETVRSLTKMYEIAPAGTREEIDAAQALSRVFHEHGLVTAQKSFNYTWHGNLGLAIVMAVLGLVSIVGVLVGGVASIVMLAVGALVGVLYLLDRLFGIKTYGLLAMTGSSQNIVARHPSADPAPDGPKARSVVVVAHYDTPRSDIFSIPQLSWIKPHLARMVDVATAVDVVALLAQVLPLPIPLQGFLAALAVLASAFLIVWSACTLLHLFVLPYTLGANDNKSGVAALLGVLDRVRPVDPGRPFGPDDEVAPDAQGRGTHGCDDGSLSLRPRRPLDAEPDPKVKGVRYGAQTIRELGILPEDCQIEYLPIELTRVRRASDANDDASQALAGNTVLIGASQVEQKLLDPEAAKDAEADAMFASIMGLEKAVSAAAPSPTPTPTAAAQTSLLSPVPDGIPVVASSDEADSELRVTGTAPRDVALQSANVSQQFIMDEPNSFAAAAIQDPTWGTSSFRPVSAAPRFLADLPDPAVAAVDPFGVSNIQTVGSYNPEDFSSMDFETGTHQALTPTMLENARRQELSGFTTELQETPKRGRRAKKNRQGRISARAKDMQQQMQEQSFNDWLGLDEGFDAKTSGAQIGTWNNFTQDDGSQTYGGNGGSSSPRWQGGAASRRTRRSTAQSEEAARLRRAAMHLGDRDLASHEVWFLLTGASEAGNAGIKDFIATYRGDLRGAYFVNLECLGVGRQSLVVEEGTGRKPVKADRRLVNIFGDASQAINRPLALERMPWRTSDASVALDEGCRAVTLCGVDRGVPAHAQWTGDSAEKLDMIAIDDAVDMVVEVIKKA